MRLIVFVSSSLTLGLVLTLSGCGAGGRVESQVGGGGRLSASTIVIKPREAADPLCNGGRGVSSAQTAAPLGREQGIASTVLHDGSVALTYNAGRSVVVQSLTSRCAPNLAFGHDGLATVTPPRPWMSVQAVTARKGGGVIVAGVYRNHAAVGEIDQHGQVVRTFGQNGRALLPFCAEPTNILQEPSGRIVVAGDGWPAYGCTGNWVAALSVGGRYDGRFGLHGIAALPTVGADSGVVGLARLRNGYLLAEVGYGNSGCWGYTLRLLDSWGEPVGLFAQRFQHLWHKLGFEAFTGAVYKDGRGFTLVGTGQRPCWEWNTAHSKSATGLVVHFRDDGYLASAPTRFASAMSGEVWALPIGRDTVVATAPYANQARLVLAAVRPNGSLDPQFWKGGHASIHVPWRGPDAGDFAALAINKVGPRAILLLAANSDTNKLLAVRLRP